MGRGKIDRERKKERKRGEKRRRKKEKQKTTHQANSNKAATLASSRDYSDEKKPKCLGMEGAERKKKE